MLQAYPKRIIKEFGHANNFLLLDETEIYTADVAPMKTANDVLNSAYKRNSTLKWLADCCPIGSFSKGSSGQAHDGLTSDPFSTQVSSILESIVYSCAFEVDDGFLIDNGCALGGNACIWLRKNMEKQTHQSKEDTALTQKVGKLQIVIDKGNSRANQSSSFFKCRIKTQQIIGLADKIFLRATCSKTSSYLSSKGVTTTRHRLDNLILQRYAGVEQQMMDGLMFAQNRTCGIWSWNWCDGMSSDKSDKRRSI
ncbi:hypothetical protein ACHAWF_002622 [Thalassiosira exigua]